MVSFGNPKGSITLVEYFDYNCPICRGFFPTIDYLAHKNSDLLVIQKVVPALAPNSQFVDRALLASFMQGKFTQMQRAILSVSNRETIPPAQVIQIAERVGLNLEKLKRGMVSPLVSKQIKSNTKDFINLGQNHIPIVEIYPTEEPREAEILVGQQRISKLQSVINSIRRK